MRRGDGACRRRAPSFRSRSCPRSCEGGAARAVGLGLAGTLKRPGAASPWRRAGTWAGRAQRERLAEVQGLRIVGRERADPADLQLLYAGHRRLGYARSRRASAELPAGAEGGLREPRGAMRASTGRGGAYLGRLSHRRLGAGCVLPLSRPRPIDFGQEGRLLARKHGAGGRPCPRAPMLWTLDASPSHRTALHGTHWTKPTLPTTRRRAQAELPRHHDQGRHAPRHARPLLRRPEGARLARDPAGARRELNAP